MKKNIKQLFFILVSAQFFAGHIAWATPTYIDHDEIRQQVERFLTDKTKEMSFKETQINIGHIDNRLRLAHCNKALEITLGNNRLPGNLSLLVQCNGAKPWKIYLQASVNAYQEIYTARVPITRGAPFNDTDLILEKRNITSLNGNYLTDPAHIKAHVARRTIRKGEIIQPMLLVKSKLVKRGEQVTLIAETSGITVRMMGKALNDATAGQQVRVRNNNSKRIVEGTAITRGVVEINM